MNIILENYLNASKQLIEESGQLSLRPGWVRCRQFANQLQISQETLQILPAYSSVLFCIIKTDESSLGRIDLLKQIFSRFLRQIPDHHFLGMLAFVPIPDLEKALLPFIYETGNLGKVACYVAAQLKVCVSPEAFEYFLKSRRWSNTDLVNLALLARKNETSIICSRLEELMKRADSGVHRENIEELRYILFDRNPETPLVPDVNSDEKPESVEKRPSESNAEKSTSMGNKDGVPLNFSQEKVREILQKPIFALSALIFSTLLLIASFSFTPAHDSPEKVIRKNRKKPEFWVDIVTQQQVSEKFIAADKDYRMGELFLTRDRFSEAASLFQDALSVDPSHPMARLRLGYCRMLQGENGQAETDFKKTLQIAPDIRLANYYLALIAAKKGNIKLADEHYAAEIHVNKDLSIALEYAGFLQEKGMNDKSEKVLDEFRKIFPDRTLVVQTTPKKPEERP
ncbi:MAG: tetratricopeptide repeat protein [Candidatus Riflebacteria bacterium]